MTSNQELKNNDQMLRCILSPVTGLGGGEAQHSAEVGQVGQSGRPGPRLGRGAEAHH